MAAFDNFPTRMGTALLAVRGLIFNEAARQQDIGPLEETLKWGQPSYATQVSKSGTPMRLGLIKSPHRISALFFHCQTSLVADFRELFPNILKFSGNRAIVIDPDRPLPEAELRHCIALALIYHRRRRQTR